ncbi:hypothetical protein GCM10010300_15950 [Streptomyces olivaceoviridis]|nr:hypothetical protein GCM10010300_15950 [Streptomyces olivaceoviridis]
MVDQLTQHDPRRIGPFEVLGRLGAGGMGLVYLARSASGRRVAIKTVRTELAEDQLFRVRFTREVEAARAVSGFYTAAVVDADPRAAVPWLATAYVPAPSLEEIVNECGPLPAQAVRWLAAGVAEALQSIHGAGLVHRDLKPSNVLVVEDGPRVIDFGIASGVSNTRLTMTNVAVGTPAYMSPEQAKDSRSVTGASDVFSLGSMLVFAATGHPPFHGANPVETVFMLLREGPDLTGLPDELRPLIEVCMQMEATGRPTPADLQAQLAPHLFGSGSDDSGTASAWLPEKAVALIEARRGGRPAVKPAPAPTGGPRSGGRQAVPPPPPYDPPVPAPASAAVPVPVGAPGTGPVRLAGAQVPIGPGPRVADARAAAVKAPPPEAGLVASWSRPRTGVAGAEPAVPPVPPQPPETAAGWRPWRFRMSNDVWGNPLRRRRPGLRHLLRGARPGRGHRPPPLQDPGRRLVHGGRGRPYPRLRRPHPVRPGRPRGHRPVAAVHGRLGVLPQGRPRHRRHRHPRRRRPGLGGDERAEAVGDHRLPDRLRVPGGRRGRARRHGLRLAGRPAARPGGPHRRGALVVPHR